MRGPAKARGAADHRLVDLFPERGRPHEGLVVEACDEDGGEEAPLIARRSSVSEGKRFWLFASRPSIELDDGCAWYWLARAPERSSTSAFGSSEPRAKNAARTVILERTADEAHAVGEQRRSQRIAGIARRGLAVEGESRAFGRSIKPARTRCDVGWIVARAATARGLVLSEFDVRRSHGCGCRVTPRAKHGSRCVIPKLRCEHPRDCRGR